MRGLGSEVWCGKEVTLSRSNTRRHDSSRNIHCPQDCSILLLLRFLPAASKIECYFGSGRCSIIDADRV